ncbi:DUF4214 domain-containing protein [Paracraurococcus lichenis]|uniref:DUF4214 domain-containing protein n=1 Tax=Paracraurococcus lichenis TaxID=3064888 RepID=A0ABT9ECR0_9PROT|nr:DUF4214 domain-containing protein [Paracraurococcus sp. LOR1-02]MDO9714002.1 DUF4214 domain-containing protein [Paracraurococcus sp. LOR1-02]
MSAADQMPTVKTYYQSILYRDPTTAESSSWASVLDSGAVNVSQFANSLLVSNEMQNYVAPVVRLYQAAFNRVPESTSAINFYASQLRAADTAGTYNTVLARITQQFSESPEFVGKYGSSGITTAFVTALYLNVLGRAPDAAGLSFYMDAKNGFTPMKALMGFSMSPEFQTKTGAGINDFLTKVAAGTAQFSGALGLDNAPSGQTFTLTTSADNLTGTAGDDVFIAGDNAGNATWTVGDTLNGGGGNDTLKIIQNAAITAVPVGFKATSVENVDLTSGGAITLNTTTGFADTTTLSTHTSGAAQTITAAATQNVSASAALQAATNVAIDGGKNVSVTATGVTTGTTTIGATTAAAGTVTVNSTASSGTQGAIAVTGGTSITVKTATSNAVNTTVTQAAVTVTGDANTTSVTVGQEKAAAASATVVGKVNGVVSITDVNAASNTKAGVITTVSLDSYDNSTINSGALKTLNLSGTGGTLGVTAGALTTPVVDTLAMNVKGLTGGAITLSSVYKTLNLDSSSTASTIADVIGSGVTALNVSGDAKLTLTADTFAAAKNIAVTNTAGVSLGTALATDVLFKGGAGADTISIGATTKAIDMGAGDDVVIVSSATLGAGGSLAGGTGTDTLVANTNGSAFSSDPSFSGFEVLRVAGAAAQGSHNANGFTGLEVGALAGAATFTNVASGVGLTMLASPGQNTTVTLANATGTNDVFGLTLKSAAALTGGTVTLAGIETVNITNTDTDTTAHTNTLTLAATSATSVTVSGNAGLNVTNTGNVKITNFDASGVTGAASDAAALKVTFVSADTTIGDTVTIKGGSGNDDLTGGSATNDSIFGGAGADKLTYTGGADSFTGGAGADTFALTGVGTKTAFLTITDASKTDILDFTGITTGTLANVTAANVAAAKVTLGAAATLDQYLDTAAAGDGGTNAVFKWFQFGGDTYAVVDNSAGATFVSATDALIKMSGLIDLSSSAITSELLTIA